MPRRKVTLRSVPAPSNANSPRPIPTVQKGSLRTFSEATKPVKVIAKKKENRFTDLNDALVTRILNLCNAKETLRGRYLSTVRQAFSLSLTCTRYFALFRNRLQTVDAFYPSSIGYPSPFLPDYLSPTQMTWIARLAQKKLHRLRLPSYTTGTTDVLVAVEYCCHSLREIAFTDRGMVFPNLASSLFSICSMITKIEIRAPQKSTIQAMWQSRCNFKEIVLLDVSTEFLNLILTLVETKGKKLAVLQIAFDINPRYDMDHHLADENERSYRRVERFGDYLTEHGVTELPKIEVLDISTSAYHVVDHDAWDVLDGDERPVKRLLRSLKTELGRVRDVKNQREKEGIKVRKIGMMRVRCGSIDFCNSMVLNHLPLNEVRTLEVVFPGGSLLFDTNDEKRPTVTALQLGLHLTHGKDCITQESRAITTVDLGNRQLVEMYYHDERGIRSRVAKVLLQESGNIKTVRGVFDLRRDVERVAMAYTYVTKVMKFAMLATTLDITFEILLYGHAIYEDFRGMVHSWKKVRMLRLLNPANYGIVGERLAEKECVAFVAGLQWLLVLLPVACPDLQVVYLEDLGVVPEWGNAPVSRNTINWGVCAVERFEERHGVDCGTLKATLKRWLRDCM